MQHKSIYSQKESNTLKVYHTQSTISSFYDMSAPIQFTLSYCSGLSAQDFFNIMTISPIDQFLYSTPIVEDFHKFNARIPHQHSFFELLIVLEGNITQKIEGKEYLYPAGSCCLINQNVIHVEKFTGEAKVLFLGLSTNMIKELLESHKTAYFPKQERTFENSIFQFMEENLQSEKGKNYLDFFPVFQNQTHLKDLHQISDQLLHEMLIPKLGSTFAIKSLVCELFQYLDTREYYHISNVTLNSSSDLLLFSRVSHLMEDTNGRMSRLALEKALCYSGNYINTIVKKYTGMCLYDYGLSFTLKNAASLLTETDISISSISAQLGFTNRTHFYKVFKAKYNISPGEYRKAHSSSQDM